MLIPTEAIAIVPETPVSSGIPRSGLRNPPSTVPTGFPLAIPERLITRLLRKGGYPQTRGGLSLLPRIFRRHQHLPLQCQLRSPECSTRFRQSLYDLVGLFRTPQASLPYSPPLICVLTTRPTPHSERLICAAPAHPRTISLYGRTGM